MVVVPGFNELSDPIRLRATAQNEYPTLQQTELWREVGDGVTG